MFVAEVLAIAENVKKKLRKRGQYFFNSPTFSLQKYTFVITCLQENQLSSFVSQKAAKKDKQGRINNSQDKLKRKWTKNLSDFPYVVLWTTYSKSLMLCKKVYN